MTFSYSHPVLCNLNEIAFSGISLYTLLSPSSLRTCPERCEGSCVQPRAGACMHARARMHAHPANQYSECIPRSPERGAPRKPEEREGALAGRARETVQPFSPCAFLRVRPARRVRRHQRNTSVCVRIGRGRRELPITGWALRVVSVAERHRSETRARLRGVSRRTARRVLSLECSSRYGRCTG